jgi:hypothetical protein
MTDEQGQQLIAEVKKIERYLVIIGVCVFWLAFAVILRIWHQAAP